MSDEWDVETFRRELPRRDRLLVLFYADWCPFSNALLRSFEEAEPESSVPFVRANLRHPQDPRWDDFAVAVVPTLVYFEHGEPLERVDGVRNFGLRADDLERLLDLVEALQEDHTRDRHRRWRRRRAPKR